MWMHVRDSQVLLAVSPEYREPTWEIRGGGGSSGSPFPLTLIKNSKLCL